MIFARFLLVPFLLCALPAMAEESPVEITAQKSIEWNRTARTYTALGDVRATRGAASVRADSLVARYKDGGGTEIAALEALGAVVIASPPYTAHGDKGVYDVKTGNAVLTGKDLRIETETEKLAARDAVRYDAGAMTLAAEGGATAVKDGNTLSADTLTAFFEKGADGKMVTKRIAAAGNISVTTARGERVTGDHGVYDVPGQQAEMTGRVVIRQGSNEGESFLEGTRATVDMRTGISKLFADGKDGTGGRVKGVFYPKKKEKP